MGLSVKTKAFLGFAFIQFWLVSIILSIYLAYRIIVYQDLIAISIFLGFTIVQQFCYKQPAIVKLYKKFEMMQHFDEHQIIELEPTQKSGALFGMHPHGIYSHGLLQNLDTPNTFFENLVPLGSRFAVNAPISGIFLKLFYGLEGVDADNLKKNLKKRQNIALVPGGFEEATITCRHENRLYIKNRKGFVKYALQYGTTLYPVFTFGENQLYYTFDYFRSFRLWLNKYKMVGTLYTSRFLTIPEPNAKMITICGKGIKCPQIDHPTKEDVDKYHNLYVNQLKELYDNYAPKYAPGIPLVLY